jgi:prepilin-type processing-associated H-X9-DG protein
MKDVEIPEGLHDRLLSGLRRARARRRRTWPLRHPRWSIAAALLLCLAGGAFGYWWQRPLPALDLSALAAKDALDGQYQIEALFAEHGIRQSLPILPYRLLVSSGMEMIQGKLVPRLRFEARDGQFAEVYILNNKDFDLTVIPAATGNFSFVPEDPGPNPKRAFLVRHGGGLPNWLFPDGRAGA